jgi:hypothetical protein
MHWRGVGQAIAEPATQIDDRHDHGGRRAYRRADWATE